MVKYLKDPMTGKRVRQGRRKTITKPAFKNACKLACGNLTVIAEKIGVARNSVCAWIERNKEYAEPLIQEGRDTLIDCAESVLLKKVRDEENLDATKFTLSTIGKHRGYVQKTETEDKTKHEPIKIQVVPPMDRIEDKRGEIIDQ